MNFDLTIHFISENDAAAGLATQGFSQYLNGMEVENEIVPNDATQDAGTIIGIILGSAAAIELAKGIAAYIKRYGVSDIEVSNGDKTIKITNVPNAQVGEIADKISSMAGTNE